MDTPLVSIILFCHAPYARFLPVSLRSILLQSYLPLEVIVLGDGSQQVERAADQFREDPRWSICSQEDQPFLQAANDTMKKCQGKYLGTWNSDDIYNPDHIMVLVQALETYPEIGAAFDNVEYFSDSQAGITLTSGNSTLGLVVPKHRAKKLAASPLSVQHIFTDNIMTGPASLIRKSAFEQVGGYDKDIFLNCDLHWFYRIAAYFPVRFVDYLGVRKRIHPLNNTAVNPHYEYGVKELEHIRTHYPDVYSRIGRSVFHKKLGRKYFRLGLYYEKNGEIHKGRDMYRRAMLLRKLSFRYSWEYVRSTIVTKLGVKKLYTQQSKDRTPLKTRRKLRE
jgi:glycosyltransferase involved in cell wall biosynthesis